MSTDWREKEREFLASLEADTGRDLAGWMALISAQSLAHRNDIIDWLRHQGFRFSRASWLERIHHNAGQPIYVEASEINGSRADFAGPFAAVVALSAAATTGPPMAVPTADASRVATVGVSPMQPVAVEPAIAEPETAPAVVPAATAAPVVEPSARRSPPVTATPSFPSPSPPDAVAETLGKAKAYRPLALHLLRGIETALPGLVLAAGAAHLVLARPAAFALVAVSGKDIRLALNLGTREMTAPFEPVRLPAPSARAAGPLTHMIVLTDARQVDAALIALVVEAAAGANT